MRRVLQSIAVVAVTGGPFLMGACVNLGEGTVSATRLYVLEPMPAPEVSTQRASIEERKTIGVGPITLPAHLDRPQLVVRASRYQLQLTEFAQWAEPLTGNVSRVLVENLSTLLPDDQIMDYPRRVPIAVDYQVALRIIRFDAEIEGDAKLSVEWGIFGATGDELLISGKTTYSEPVTAKGAEAIVLAESRALERLSRDIAQAIQGLRQRGGRS